MTSYIEQELDYWYVVDVLQAEGNKFKHVKSLETYIELYCRKHNDYMLKEFLTKVKWMNITPTVI